MKGIIWVGIAISIAAALTAEAKPSQSNESLLARWKTSEQPMFCTGDAVSEGEMEIFKQSVVAEGLATIDFRSRRSSCTLVLCSDASIPLQALPDRKTASSRYVPSREGKLPCFRDRPGLR